MLLSRTLNWKTTIHSKYLEEDIVDLLSKTFEIPADYDCELLQIDPGYECRADLVADIIYNDELYSDLILKLNGPSNPFELNENYIVVPTADHINNFMITPNPTWEAEKTYSPKPKSRKEKRKPNESVVGDTRFNIDQASKIVIY